MASAKVVRQPTEKPEFTVKTLRDSIPKHCFERNLVKSLLHLAYDIAVVVALGYAASWIDHPAVPRVLANYVLWPAYWFWQGAFCTGIWVIAHECGHGAFSPYTWVNDAVGLVLHSLLLVPYYSWKHSHRRHHSNTGNLEKDEVFVPGVVDDDHKPNISDAFIVRVLHLIATVSIGWLLYLFFNAAGRSYGFKWVNHFDPYSPIFSKRERAEVLTSDISLVVVCYGLYLISSVMGFSWLLKMYLVPYFVVNFWLVMITLLQHTHPALAHYDSAEWDWLRGALSTVDRSYGFLDHIFHHISDTHVAHHLFSQMPHYHAVEATKHLKKVLGRYYMHDSRNVFKCLWTDWIECRHVSQDKMLKGVYWFRKS